MDLLEYLQQAITQLQSPSLRAANRDEPAIQFESGLSTAEIESIQERFEFRFPPDLVAFLQLALPVSPGFPNWRPDPPEVLRHRLAGPADGIVFDITKSEYWYEKWGPRPAQPEEAEQVARQCVAQVPTLIPVFIHRYIPAEPHEPGNPILSVHQTDVIYYGNCLGDYLSQEFGVSPPTWRPTKPRRIVFWSDLVEEW
jgi:hypothetical protein